MAGVKDRRPLEEQEVVVHVPKGMGRYVKIEESEPAELPNEIVVQVSKKRQQGVSPMLGVIVK